VIAVVTEASRGVTAASRSLGKTRRPVLVQWSMADDVIQTEGTFIRSANQVVGFLTLVATGVALAGWMLLGLGGILPGLPALFWTVLTLPAILLGSALIADPRISEGIRLVREIAALILLVGLIRRLGQTESAPWSDLADLLRSIVAGG
jgi:hypothetical protein